MRPDTGTGSWSLQDSRLILILSSERSGSTLLRVLLGNHPQVVSPPELWLLEYREFDVWLRERAQALESVVEYFRLVGHPLTRTEICEACRGKTTHEVYRWLFEFLPARCFLIDKTPGYANSPATLARSTAFRPFYIWLIRHPLGVINSHVTLAWRRHSSWRPTDVKWRLVRVIERIQYGARTSMVRERETKWVRQNTNIGAFLWTVPAEQQARVIFKDLVADPENTLQGLCAGMGLRASPRLAHLQPETWRIQPGLGDPAFHEHLGIEPQTAGRWREHFTEEILGADTVLLMKSLGLTSAPKLVPGVGAHGATPGHSGSPGAASR